MATSPIELPTNFPCRARKFQIITKQEITPSGSGFVQTVNRSEPFWVAEYETPPLNASRYNDVISFLDQLDGSKGTFLAYDPRKPMPYAYSSMAVGSNPWHRAGLAPRFLTVNYSTGVVTMDRLATGAIITKGDLISITVGNKRYLHRTRVGATANASGLASITVYPSPVYTLAASTDIRYQKAVAEMKVLGGYSEQDSVDSLPVISFKAAQFIDRT